MKARRVLGPGTRGHVTRRARPRVRQPGTRHRCSNKNLHTRVPGTAPHKGGAGPGAGRRTSLNNTPAGLTAGRRAAGDQGHVTAAAPQTRARPRGRALRGPSPTRRPDHASPQGRTRDPGLLGSLPANGRRAAHAVDVHASTRTCRGHPKVKRAVPVGLCPSPAGCPGPSSPLPQNEADVGLWGVREVSPRKAHTCPGPTGHQADRTVVTEGDPPRPQRRGPPSAPPSSHLTQTPGCTKPVPVPPRSSTLGLASRAAVRGSAQRQRILPQGPFVGAGAGAQAGAPPRGRVRAAGTRGPPPAPRLAGARWQPATLGPVTWWLRPGPRAAEGPRPTMG